MRARFLACLVLFLFALPAFAQNGHGHFRKNLPPQSPITVIITADFDRTCIGWPDTYHASYTYTGNSQAPPQYQWSIDNVDIPGATSDSFSYAFVDAAD